MSFDVFVSAFLFVLVGSFTPGPNNTMLMASGLNYGFWKTLPHLSGVIAGYCTMFAIIALGAGRIFQAYPLLYDAMRALSAIYLLWLAWRIATDPGEGGHDGHTARGPLSFLEAALFQWINPKGFGLAVVASANFLEPERLSSQLPVMLALLFVMSLASGGSWTLFGQALRRWLGDERRRVWFNRAMALALVASLWPVLSAGLPAR